jgi:hypothetical protein
VFDEEPIRFVRPRAEYRQRSEPDDRWVEGSYPVESSIDTAYADGELGVSLPVHMI